MKHINRRSIPFRRSLFAVTTAGLLLIVGSEPVFGDETPEPPAGSPEVSETGRDPQVVATELPEFGDWRDYLEPGDRWLFWMLDQPVPAMEVPKDTPLSDILAKFADHFTVMHGRVGEQQFVMSFWPDDATLELENIDSLDDVEIAKVDLVIPPIKLRTALRLVFERTVDPPLSCVIRNGVIEVTTVDEARSESGLMTRIYPVADLIDGMEPRALRGFDGELVQTSSSESSAEKLRKLVLTMTAPATEWTELDGQGGVISVFRDHLVVLQTESGHASVAHLLKLLRRTAPADTAVSPAE